MNIAIKSVMSVCLNLLDKYMWKCWLTTNVGNCYYPPTPCKVSTPASNELFCIFGMVKFVPLY